jgi:2-keto-3-deoxy-L-rhamnonate aldolase RhmA
VPSSGYGPHLAGILRSSLKGSDGARLAWFVMGSVPTLEVALAGRFDAVVIDLQHGLWDRMGAHLAVTAAGATPVLARSAENSTLAISEALDCGAAGVIVPMIETVAQVQTAVLAASYPPEGIRSAGGVRLLGYSSDAFLAQSARPVIGVMIETAPGLDNIEKIVGVPGIDLIFIGTGDLAMSLGCFPVVDERHVQACAVILRACQARGVACGIFAKDAAQAATFLNSGYQAAVVASDLDVLRTGFGAARVTA